MKTPVKYANKRQYNRLQLWRFPNAGPHPNITGMRRIYGPHAFLVQSGQYLYNVPASVYYSL